MLLARHPLPQLDYGNMGVITCLQGLCIHKLGMDSPASKTWQHPDHGDNNGIYTCETQQSIRYQQMPHLPSGILPF
jgi:hypothetical protein